MPHFATDLGLRLRFLALASLAACGGVARADTPARLSNISTRGPVGTGADIMIAGLVIGPGSPETVLIRADGPSLGLFGVTGVLQAPVLSLYDSGGTLIQTNQGWGMGNATAAIMASTGAFALPVGSADSALVATLPAGAYTAQVTGANGTTGVALLEVYEVGATAATARLINLSTRGQVGTSGNIMIPGITIGPGSGSRTLLIRAAGPALTPLNVPGALADPTFSVVNTANGVIAGNDNWGTPIGDAPDAAALGEALPPPARSNLRRAASTPPRSRPSSQAPTRSWPAATMDRRGSRSSRFTTSPHPRPAAPNPCPSRPRTRAPTRAAATRA